MDSSSETDAVGPTASPPAAGGPPQQSSSTTPENPLPPSISSQNPQPPLNHNHLQHHLLQTQQPNFQQRPPINLSRAQQPSFQSGGVALGVPARQQQMPPSSFSAFGGPFNQPFGGMPRNSVNMQETNPQVRQTSKGIQSIGMIGSLGSSSQMRPSGPPGHNLQRPGQPPMRTQSPSNNQSLATQKFQSPGMMRVPSIASTSSPSTGTVQASQSHPQPWMSTQGKQMHSSALSSSSYRPQMKPPSMQRPHLPQQYTHSMPTSHQQHIPPTHQQQQQQPSQSHQSQEHQGQQYPSARIPQTAPHLQQVIRGPGSANQKSLVAAAVQPNVLQSGPLASLGSNEIPDGGTHILSKRSIQELVTQIDPSERLDPEVEDVLVDIAEDFVESITTFACSLAKHRKSTTLEAKDILLHLERNWNMTLPGFGGDELKAYKKPLTNDVHRERLAAIKKSVIGTEAGMPKNSTGQAAANMKGHTAKAPVGSEK